MLKKGVHFLIKGRVQGVWYRDFAKRTAKELGITGWVRNRPDRDVEIVAYGDCEKLTAYQKLLYQGPRLAAVSEIIAEDVPFAQHADFIVIY